MMPIPAFWLPDGGKRTVDVHRRDASNLIAISVTVTGDVAILQHRECGRATIM